MSATERWVIECRPAVGGAPSPFADWLDWPVEKDQEIVQTEAGRLNWIITRIEHYGEPTIRTPFMIGWTGLPTVDMRIRRTVGEST